MHIPVKDFLQMNMLKSHGHLNKPLDIGKEKLTIGDSVEWSMLCAHCAQEIIGIKTLF